MSDQTGPKTIACSDPDVDWNDHGEVFVNYLLVCDRAAGVFTTLVVARSADGGASWTPQGVISNGFGSVSIDDKNFYAVDDDPASPYYGRHYACWDRNQDEKFAYSTTNGATWKGMAVADNDALPVNFVDWPTALAFCASTISGAAGVSGTRPSIGPRSS